MACIVKTGVVAHDNTCLAAEQTRAAAVAAASTQQAINAAEVTYYKACKASALANGLTGELGSYNLVIRQLNGVL